MYISLYQMPLKLRYISDIHLELLSNREKLYTILDKLNPDCDFPSDEVCILAGDIGNPYSSYFTSFMNHMNRKYKKTFFVPGNHEYYNNGATIEETNSYMEYIFAKNYPNIEYLNNRVCDYMGYRFIGTTLWSHVTNKYYTINDMSAIRGLDINIYNNMHQESLEFLYESLKNSPEPTQKNNIVITHHMPLNELIHPVYLKPPYNKYNQWFSSDLGDFVGSETCKKSVYTWIYGHTHIPNECNLYDIHFACNPIGYENEFDEDELNYEKYIILP